MAANLPSADNLKTWSTSKLIACYVQLQDERFGGNARNATLRRMYAAEIDRRFPVVP